MPENRLSIQHSHTVTKLQPCMITKLKKGDKSNGKYIWKPSLHFISLGTMNVVDTIPALAKFICIGAGTGPAGLAMAGPFSAEIKT